MFRFARAPDAIFVEMVNSGIGFALDHLALLEALEETWDEDFPQAARVFPVQVARTALARLREAGQEAALYELSPPQWLLLYDALHFLAENHNGLYGPEKPGPIGPYEVGRIKFEALIDRFFPVSRSELRMLAGRGRVGGEAAALQASADSGPGEPALVQPSSPPGTVVPEYPEEAQQHIE